ncbi:MAG: trimethoprim-resistant dihydrofolate reductase DfrA [Porticoccaceae bacterium]
MSLKLSLIAARSRNGVIGNGPDIPWHAKGEQLLFKAMTYNQWLLVGRKTFESMGVLPNRKYAVVSRSGAVAGADDVLVFASIAQALAGLAERTDHAIVAGGGEIYASLIDQAQTLHLSVVDIDVEGDVRFPAVPASFQQVFEQSFESNINYRYQIWQRR